MFILDTSILIELLHGTQIGRQISEEIKEEVATTVFSIYELKKGERKNEAEIIDLFLSNIKVLDFGVLAARESSKIEKELSEKGKLINRVDIFIASICNVEQAKLITLDKDFKKISSLKVRVFKDSY